jgi:hypothetical protein
MPDQPRGDENEVEFSYEYGEEKVGRGDDLWIGRYDNSVVVADDVPEEDEDDECVESKDKRGEGSVGGGAAVLDISDNS